MTNITLCPQAIVSTGHEFNEAAVAQILQLLPDFRANILIAGMQFAKMPIKRIDVIQRELVDPEPFDAIHHIQQPSARLQRLVAQEQRFLPFLEDRIFGTDDAVLDDMNLARIRDTIEQNVRPNPSGTARGRRKRFALLDDVANEEMLRHLPRSITLMGTFAHVMTPVIVAFSPPSPEGYHPPPWKAARGGFSHDVTAQLAIPASAGRSLSERQDIGRIIVFLLRLWCDPSITVPAIANMPFSEIAAAAEGAAHIGILEHERRRFMLEPADRGEVIESIDWVRDNFETAFRLSIESAEFRFAVQAMDRGQFLENTGLTMISLWAALEAIFSPSMQELKFRVSSLIASYLYEAGPKRMQQQQKIGKLYDRRSAAAHGKPKHDSNDLLSTFELLRSVLIKIIREGRVPTKEQLEAQLFGA